MSDPTPDHAEEEFSDRVDSVVPGLGHGMTPVVALGGSAGAIPALEVVLGAMPQDTALAFVVILHLSPEHESSLAELLQRRTKLRVTQAEATQELLAGHVYVIPPAKAIRAVNGHLTLADDDLTPRGRHVAVDLFFRTLADTHGPRAAAVVLSGADGDGAIGIKRIKERGGLTVAQDPDEAEHASMPRTAIATGMVDWVLPVQEISGRLLKYFDHEKLLKLPPEDGPTPAETAPPGTDQEVSLRDVLAFLRARTGRDFSYYKRATVLRRIARRMQVNTVEDLPSYMECLRTVPGESAALLQDLLISVTNFFRDADCFGALEGHLDSAFAGKGPNDTVRAWVAGCATGEEAYTLAILLSEKARRLEMPPAIQVFATDLSEDAIRSARDATYPATIEADVSEDLLRRYFVRGHRGYQVKRELRERVLFAQHDLLKDSPFSRLDLVTCRNLLIYLNRNAQQRTLETFHFSLLPHGLLFLGSSESVEESGSLFKVLDKKNRIFTKHAVVRSSMPIPVGPGTLALAVSAQRKISVAPVAAPASDASGVLVRGDRGQEPRSVSWGELHFKLLEALATPSVLVDAQHDILHLSPGAGRFLHHAGGEPSRNLLKAVHPSMRVELRGVLYLVQQTGEFAEVVVRSVELEGRPLDVVIRAAPARDIAPDLLLVTFASRPATSEAPDPLEVASVPEPVATHLERELERVKFQLRDTVEQYEASTEELKAGNEELQAMNEELRSASEELETSREELQSINEELRTVNYELKSNIDELGHSNSDLNNLMDATEIATIFLDRELRINRYTPWAVSLFNLIPSDIGRPLADLATRLDYPQLDTDARRVLERLIPIEREVGLRDGSWFMVRMLPYRTVDDRIAGVVASFIDITERKKADEMRRWLSAVASSSLDAIISFAPDLAILSWNSGAAEIFGYDAGEAIGRSLDLLHRNPEADAQELKSVLRDGQAVKNLERVRLHKDGGEVHVVLSISPITDGTGRVIGGTAIARDVGEHKRASEALRISEERLRLMVESASDFAIFSTDLQRRITSWNAGAERLLGYREGEQIGALADIIFTPEDQQARVPERECATALASGRAGDDRPHMRKDGSLFWASGAMMPMLDGAGQPVGFVKVLRDMTADRLGQEALERSQAELMQALAQTEQARAALQEADAAKDRFLAVLSHELRNPLASIDSAASLLLTPAAGGDDREQAAQVVQRQVAVMRSLMNDLLDVSRLTFGRLELHREQVVLAPIVESAVETIEPLRESAGHKLTVDLPAYAVQLDADPIRISQVVSNLLTNAIKYTPPGGEILLKVRMDGGQVVICVTDNGIGMEPGEIEDMFVMFAQAKHVVERTNAGLGIGLALVRNIVELHGGTVEASSAGPGKGSEFSVRLPAKKAAAGAMAPAALAPAAYSSADKRGLILIADDNVDAGWGIAKLMELSGFATVRVQGGVEAVREAQLKQPDVAILDIGMPDLSGHEVARQIRAAPGGQKMILIAATGWGQDADQRRAFEAGFDAHMTKPVDVLKLSAVIDDLLQKRRR